MFKVKIGRDTEIERVEKDSKEQASFWWPVTHAPTIDTGPEGMKAISRDSWWNQMKLISQILFSVYHGHRKQHWGGRKLKFSA